MMQAQWIAPITIILLAVGFMSLSRLKIPRDLSQEGLNDYESTLAYDSVSRSPLFSFIRFLTLNQVKKSPPRGILLDAGCGPGYLDLALAEKYPELTILGIDNAPDMLGLATRNLYLTEPAPRVTFLEGDVQSLPVENDSIDFVISTLSLHHWPEPEKAFREIYRILKPGGCLLICDLRRDMPRLLFHLVRFGQNLVAPPPIRRVNGGVGSIWSSYTPTEMESLLSASPFSDYSIEKGWGWAYIRGKKVNQPS